MNRISDEIERLKLQATMLLIADDWRGLGDTLETLNRFFRLDPSTGLAFYREIVRYDAMRRKYYSRKCG